MWGLDGSQIQKQTHVLEFIEKQLVGKNAEHGGDAVKAQPRKFGLRVPREQRRLEGARRHVRGGHGARSARRSPRWSPTSSIRRTIQQQASQVITKLKAAGVTTVVFSGDPVAPRDFTKEATAQEYFPEWVVAASTLVDVTAFARTYDQQQWAHAFGVTQLAARSDARPEPVRTPTTCGSTAPRRPPTTPSVSSLRTRRCCSPCCRARSRT